MEFVENVFACAHCSNTFQSPIALPCGVTICKHHIKETDKKYFCETCNVDHPIPKGGFKINQALEKMLKSKINSLHFGEEYQSAVDAVKKLEDLITKYRLLKEDPNFEIDKVIGDIKSNIDLKREQLKLEIDKEAELLIQQMIEFEKECKEKAKEFDFKSIDEKVKTIEAEIETSRNELNVLLIDKEKWNGLKETLEAHFRTFNCDLIKIRENLFLNKLDRYQRDKSFQILLSNTNTRRIDLKVVKCKQYENTKLKQFEKSIFDEKMQLNWTIKVQFTKIEAKPANIGLFLSCSKKIEPAGSLIAKCQLKIWNRKNSSEDFTKVLEYDLVQKDWGFTNFIALADLVKNEELYDPIEDSFTAEMVILDIIDKRLKC